MHHYNGRGGRVFPLWRDVDASSPNFPPKLLPFLAHRFLRPVAPEDFFAYIAALAAHPAFTSKFQHDLSTPGLRIPITADASLFSDVVELGRTVIWLHTFGERMADPQRDRPDRPPRLPKAKMPRIPADGAIPEDPESMPGDIAYDAATKRLRVGGGFVEDVEPAVWHYEVSGKQVLLHWFSYRKKNRERPIIGNRRQPSPLVNIQPDHWLAEYTTELINVLNVLGRLVELEPHQAELLEKVCGGEMISAEELRGAGALERPVIGSRKKQRDSTSDLFAPEAAD